MIEDVLPDLRLIAVLDPGRLRGRDLVRAACDAVAGGATLVQLRMKGVSAAAYHDAARLLVGRVPAPVYINDRADVAWTAGAAGVHVGPDDIPAGGLRAAATRPFGVGVSVGSRDEAAAVPAGGVDYWSVGPVFRTASKPDAGEPLGVTGWRTLAALAPPGMPVVGIGGIDPANAAAVIRAGAAGVAVIRAICDAPDIRRAARDLRDAVDAAGH
ncbi:MAG TPA: thiamine phosphate synthase [Gemmatimonadales bacterium]|nr:thiamine phosphate synthase [Gemmatimonadales bacterium]